MRSIATSISLLFVSFVAFTATASAATLADDLPLLDLAKPILTAVRGGQYAFAAAAALVLLVALAKRYASPRFPALRSSAGQAALVLVGSFGGALATALAAGGPITFGLAWSAAGIAATAAGGYSLIKKLVIDPLVRPWAARAPAWVAAPLALLLWVFDKPSPVATATRAGEIAVAKRPSAGAAVKRVRGVK